MFAAAACGPGGPAPTVSDAAPGDAAEVDAPDAGRPAGARCEADGECAASACVHGVCSPPCAGDADCGGDAPMCVVRGGEGRCSRRCAAAADCGDGLLCAVLGPGRGFCVAPGPGGAGAPCAERADCAGWVCQGRCFDACAPEGACPPGQVCLPLHTQAVCVTAGGGDPEAPCGVGADCLSGVCRGGRCASACPEGTCADDRDCVVYEALALCERRCARAADCGEGAGCAVVGGDRLCVARGEAAAGAACAADAECASGHCANGGCAAPCDAETRCPAGSACLTDLAGGFCVPAGGAPVGGACREQRDCSTGFCAAGRCSTDCFADGTCPDGTRCAAFVDGRYCFPACERDGDCAPEAFCDRRPDAGGVCLWRGDGVGACGADRDCASGRCAEGRCLAACPDGVCPGDQLCLDFDTAALCSPTPRPRWAECAGEDCAEGLSCVAGRCLPSCEGGCPPASVCAGERCHPACAGDGDCRPGRICNRFDGPAPYCDAPGPVADGGACARAGECASGRCAEGACRSRCGDCGPGAACVGGWCAPVGERLPGERCDRGGECASGVCAGRRCATPCADGACAPGAACRALGEGDFCVATCDPAVPDGCGDGEVCAPEGLSGAGTCAAAAPLGEECATVADCGPRAAACVAVDPLAGGRCASPCRPEAGGCGPGEACVAVEPGAALGVCLPVGALEDGAPCAAGRECASGRCDGHCRRACAADADCADGTFCVDAARDPAAADRRCAPACADAADCPPGVPCRRRVAGPAACY